jgi:two-component system sensor histidine kinase SenX3
VGAISLLAETLSTAADDPEAVRKFSTQMQTEAQRLSSLVQEIIELSRLQDNGALADMRSVPLADVIAEVIDREKTAAAAKNITVVAAGAEDVLVYADAGLLTTAIRNLVDNAISYSPDRTRVGIGVREVGGMVEIAVVDQGIGVSEAEQARVFERFYRSDPARSRVTGGTGLGLSIVKHIAAGHGGDVSVWSSPKRGSTFTLRIPAADVTGEGPGAADMPGVRRRAF